MKAHQRLVRERRAAEDADLDLFGRWWSNLNLDVNTAQIRPVSRATAEGIIEKYEWLGTMPAVVRYAYGIFFDGCCGGVVTYGDDYTENLGVWDKYGYTGKLILLSRGACVHWTPPNTASKLIRHSIRLLPDRYKVITATVDSEAGEVGTIYQACGFDYVRMNQHPRYGVENGPASRALRAEGILINKAQIVAAGLTPKLEHLKPRYFAFRGSHAEVKRLRRAIAHLRLPYPKRDAEEVSSQRDDRLPTDRAGGSSPTPLQLTFAFVRAKSLD